VLDAFPDGPSGHDPGPIVPQPSMRKLGNGTVKRAVVEALTAGNHPMRVADVQTVSGFDQTGACPLAADEALRSVRVSRSSTRPGCSRIPRRAYGLRTICDTRWWLMSMICAMAVIGRPAS
jgi:hypothetical protein